MILKLCRRLGDYLTQGDSKDVDESTLQEVLNNFCENELVHCVLNLVTAIKLLLTLPVSVASGEPSFI